MLSTGVMKSHVEVSRVCSIFSVGIVDVDFLFIYKRLDDWSN